MHYSFDLWMTLIKSNPEFKKHRASYFHTVWNPLRKPFEEVEDIISFVDDWANNANEQIGGNIDASEMYFLVLTMLGVKKDHLTAKFIELIYEEIANIFFQFPPVPFDKNVVPTLLSLVKKGNTIGLLSNTGFINGNLIRLYFEKSDFRNVEFKSLLFSDEHRTSKPNVAFFMKMLDVNKTSQGNCIHIGDNPFADGFGAQKAGIPFLIINNKECSKLTIKDVLNEDLFKA